MNFILKDDAEGVTVEAKLGEYSEGDGQQYSIAANIGLPLSAAGFANFSFEYSEQDPTDRSVQRDDAAGLIEAGNTAVANPAQIWGSPEITNEVKVFANLGLDLGGGTSAYMHGNYASKHVDGGFYFRNPNTRGAVFSGDGGDSLLIGDLQLAETGVSADCPEVPITDNVPDSAALAEVFAREECFSFREIFPGGFTPRFGGDVTDAAFAAGVRGEMENGLRWDVSVGAGLNDVDFFINNTVNASLGPATPTEFNPGDYTQIEQMLNIDFAYSPTPTTKPRRCARRRLNSGFASTTSSSAS